MTIATRPHTKCRREKCRERFDAHILDEDGKLPCPNGSGEMFIKHVPRPAASQSFNEGEIKVVDFIVTGLQRGKDVRMATRHEDFMSFVGKVKRMKAQVERLKEERKAMGYDD